MSFREYLNESDSKENMDALKKLNKSIGEARMHAQTIKLNFEGEGIDTKTVENVVDSLDRADFFIRNDKLKQQI
tara:strand:- start:181 stop:402 length:222 start_codon:yes stop_codon:yes gene_type:complete